MFKLPALYYVTYLIFLYNKELHKNKRHALLFIGKSKNPINY